METIEIGAMLGWVWQPTVSPLHIFGGSAVLVVLALFAYARTFKGRALKSLGLLAMRLVVIIALAVLLMGPSVIPPHVEQVHKPRLLIFVDTSGSMLTRDCADMGRLEFAQRQWLKRDNLEALSEVYDLSYFGFDSEVRPLSVTALEQPASSLATGRVSRIAHCLETALGKLGPESSDAAMLVLSDGHDTESTPMQPVALLARARGIPIHTVSLGGPTLQSDLLLVAIANQQYLLAGEQGHIIAKVHQVGLGDARVSLHLRCNDQHRSQTIAFDGRQSVTVKLPVKQEKPGLYEYKISVDTVKGETEEGNNAQSVFLEVTDRRIKVLLLEGEPFWDTKFIAQTLRKDARIELTQISQLSSRKQEKIVTRSDRAGAQIPLDAEEIAKFDVIILGRGLEHFLDRRTAKLLPDFVSERGGSIVFARGRAYDPDTASGRQMGRDIAVLEPVVWGVGLSHNLSLQLTPAGLSSPCFAFGAMGDDIRRTVADLPGFTVMPVIEREKAATVVLARALAPGRAAGPAGDAGTPAVVTMNYGRGRVVAVLGEGLWRWSFLPPDLEQFDGVYDLFWSNMIRWLAMGSDFLPGYEVSLKLSRSSVRLGDPVQLDVVCRLVPKKGFNPKVKIVDPDAKTHALVLKQQAGMESRRQGEFTPKLTGVYKVVLECPDLKPPRIEKRFNVYDVNMERLQTSANPDAMRVLAEQSGGRFLQADQVQHLPDELAKLRTSREVPKRPEYIWPKGIILVILLVWAGIEWLLRKRSGLL